MALPIISADERLAQRKGIKGVIFGRSGIVFDGAGDIHAYAKAGG